MAETNVTSASAPASETRPRKHWLDYLDVFARSVIGTAAVIAGIWWANNNSSRQASLNTYNQVQQIKKEAELSGKQREMAEAQLASGLLTFLKCENSPQRLMAEQILLSVSDKQFHLVEHVLAKCSASPRDRELAEKYSLQSSLAEQRQDFLRMLGIARQYRIVGDHENAAREYARAYNQLPESLSGERVPATAKKGREALENGDFRAASDLFEQAFSLIEIR